MTIALTNSSSNKHCINRSTHCKDLYRRLLCINQTSNADTTTSPQLLPQTLLRQRGDPRSAHTFALGSTQAWFRFFSLGLDRFPFSTTATLVPRGRLLSQDTSGSYMNGRLGRVGRGRYRLLDSRADTDMGATTGFSSIWRDVVAYRRAYLLTAVASFGGMSFH